MVRPAYPLVLLAALAAGGARAQDGDRYGPRPARYVGGGAAPVQVALTSAPALRTGAPLLRSLSWPGKVELRPALAPAGEGPAGVASPASFPASSQASFQASFPSPLRAPSPPSPAPALTYALRSAPAPTGRFAGMAAYGAAAPGAAPALRPAAAPYANVPAPSTAWPAPTRKVRRGRAAASAPPAAAPQPIRLPDPAAVPAQDGRTSGRAGGSNLPPGLAAPPAYVPPGPAYGPALAAQAADQARAAAAATADTLPPPTVGRYGYVGPGRAVAAPAASPITRPVTRTAPPPAAPPPTPVAAAPPAPDAATGLGPPRPPVYARGYILPVQAAASVASAASPVPAGGAGARTVDGVRRYSVHREYGMEPDPVPVPPQFFAATPDLSAPETQPAAPRNSRAAVNAARLAAAGG